MPEFSEASTEATAAARQTLREFFGFDEFRGRQAEIITRLLAHPEGHALVLMPTGGGKSLCYQLPALTPPLADQGGTIVVSPLIALMQDQVEALQRRGISADFINSTIGAQARERRLAAFVAGELKLLYVTPERFRKRDFVERLRESEIALFAVDEAHCISEWGGDFRPDYGRLGEFRARIGNPRTIALTATATPEVQEDIIARLGLASESVQVFHEGIDRPNLRLEARDVISDEEKLKIIQRVLASAKRSKNRGAGIVYFALIKTLEECSRQLRAADVPHEVYHGKLPADRRKRAQRYFMAAGSHENANADDPPGQTPLILATNAFGMGIDKADIRFVIHAELPGSLEAYYQEIGRAGRDGRRSLCLLLYSQADLNIQMDFIKWSNPEPRIYQRICEALADEGDRVRALGTEYLREQLHYKNRHDFRIETALRMLDRYALIEGLTPGGPRSAGDDSVNDLGEVHLAADFDPRDIDTLPESSPARLLFDQDQYEAKLVHEQKRLAQIVHYFRTKNDCRRKHLSAYFGFPDAPRCENCDRCTRTSK